MTYFRKPYIGGIGIAFMLVGIVVLEYLGTIFRIQTITYTASAVIFILGIGIYEFTQIDLKNGLIRKKIIFLGITFGKWYKLKDFDYLLINSESKDVSSISYTFPVDYTITSYYLILGSKKQKHKIIIKKDSVKKLQKIGYELKNHFPHLDLVNEKNFREYIRRNK